jgi:large subunit ribosomal protein L17
MRHRKDHRKLSRTSSHRKALLRNLVTSLFQYERIHTTLEKAKEARRLAERLITFGKRGDLAARRHVARFVTVPDVTRKLFATVAPWYTERNGGYTRIVRVGRRLGDAGETAYLELVKTTAQKEQERKDRIAAAEAREKALKGDKPSPKKDKKKAEAAEGEAATEGDRPKRRGRKGGDEGTPQAPTRKRTRTGVKTG